MVALVDRHAAQGPEVRSKAVAAAVVPHLEGPGFNVMSVMFFVYLWSHVARSACNCVGAKASLIHGQQFGDSKVRELPLDLPISPEP